MDDAAVLGVEMFRLRIILGRHRYSALSEPMLDRGEDRQPEQDEGDCQGKGQAEYPMSLQKRGRRSHSGPNTLLPPVRTSPAHVLGPLLCSREQGR